MSAPKRLHWTDPGIRTANPDGTVTVTPSNVPPESDGAPRTALDKLWHELIWSALASDGPIRDSDVKNAVKIWRPRIEAEAAALPHDHDPDKCDECYLTLEEAMRD